MTMGTLFQDTRYALRGIRRRPGFAFAIVLSLALAIGANTAIFSFFDAILLRALPFREADRLVRIRDLRMEASKEPVPISVTPANFVAWKEMNRVFAGLSRQVPTSFNLTGDGDPEYVSGAEVSANFLTVLGVRPALGRGFLAGEDQPGHSACVVLLGHDLWDRRFGGAPTILGRTMTLDRESCTVVGVLPPRFRFPYGAEVWRPVGLDPTDQSTWHRQHLNVFGRLKPGVTLAAARVEMEGIAARLAKEYPATNEGWSTTLDTVREDMVGKMRPWLLAIFGASCIVLLIACVNSANLLLARAMSQSHEVSIRVALGSSRWRLALQFFTQSLVLALLGGALGVLLAYWTLPTLVRLSPVQGMDSFFQESLRIDFGVLGFALLVSLLVGVLFGVLPALRAARPDLQSFLKEGGRAGSGRREQRWLGGLVVCEIALALVLLAGAGLLLESFARLQQVDLGFPEKHLLAVQMTLPASKYRNRHQQVAFYTQLLDRIRALPGVRAAGVTTNNPFTGEYRVAPFVVEGRPKSKPDEFYFTNHRVVSPGYLETLGCPLLRGRTFTPADRDGSPPVVIVSRRFAETYWPGTDALGKRVKADRPNFPWMMVVGVVGDVKDQGDYKESWYVPFDQEWRYSDMNLLVRAEGDPLTLVDPVRRAVLAIDQDQPVYGTATMESLAADALSQQRFSTLLYSLFGGLALILTVVGIYGVMSYLVAQRVRDFGIRRALGAQTSQVTGLVMRRAMRLILIGLIVGGGIALALGRFLASLLYGVSPTDPLTLACVVGGMTLVALAASGLPARQATKVDPMTALRHE